MVSFDPTTLGHFLVAFFALAVFGVALALAAVTEFVATHRPLRRSRQQPVRVYYRRLALSH